MAYILGPYPRKKHSLKCIDANLELLTVDQSQNDRQKYVNDDLMIKKSRPLSTTYCTYARSYYTHQNIAHELNLPFPMETSVERPKLRITCAYKYMPT